MTHRRSRSNRTKKRNARDVCEWIGGQVTPPWFITDREEPYRPVLTVWIEVPSGLVVGQNLAESEAAKGCVGETLNGALQEPASGPPRRPDRIRVADDTLAHEVYAAVGDQIPIVVAPTPELDAFVEEMVDAMSKGDETRSYFEGGRIAPDVIAELFAAAQVLYHIAPWKVAADSQVLRMDIPELGVQGACVSIIGQLGESLGVLIFPSIEGFEAFLEAAEREDGRKGRRNLGTELLSLTFDRGADLPRSMQREVAVHGWPVADADAYPHVERRESDGASRPIVERDVKIAMACARSLSAFFVKHRRVFEQQSFDPICESYFDRNDLEVRFTTPYEALGRFDVDDEPMTAQTAASRVASPPRGRPATASKVGRNDPCPCGSGRKYKKCHLLLDEQQAAERAQPDPSHELDHRVVNKLVDFATQRFHSEWMQHAENFDDPSRASALAAPWSVYGHRMNGKTAADWYLEEHGEQIPRAERRWLIAQQRAWLSVWEVTEVEPGTSVTLQDMLSGQTRCVRETEASLTLVVRDVLLARVVDHDGASVLCGVHPQPLPPVEAADLVRRARGRLRRKRAVPVDRLREENFARYLIRRWEDAVAELHARRSRMPELCNSDGDPMLLTTDHFEVVPGSRASVESSLAAMEDVAPPGPGDETGVYVFTRPGTSGVPSMGSTVIGHAQLSDSVLQLDTNSLARADALRERVEAACGEHIRHRAREHADPMSSAATPFDPSPVQEAVSPEVEAVMLEFKQQHLRECMDLSVPALEGKTPREAAKTANGRAAVDALLKSFENHEHRAGSGAALDFAGVREELGLE